MPGANYRLAPSSPFKNAGTDGKEVPFLGEVASVRLLADRRSLRWDAEPGSDRHDVSRGGLLDLRDDRDFRDAACFEDEVAVTPVDHEPARSAAGSSA